MVQRRTAVPIIALLLFVGTLVLYYPALHNGFVNYDDTDYVTSNFHVQQGLTKQSVAWAFTSTAEANWHPLTWLSHMLDVRLFGLRPAGHHAQSIFWHAVNVVLLFLLLARATGFIGRSAIVAALFAVHPLNVESVAWVAERKSVLCAFFLLLAFAAYGWYVKKPRVTRYLLVALLFAFALMAKPMAITLPFPAAADRFLAAATFSADAAFRTRARKTSPTRTVRGQRRNYGLRTACRRRTRLDQTSASGDAGQERYLLLFRLFR